ncbi:hypothetical protein AB4455_07320 [Vibrio sp. 10N.261.46.E12]|uniref:hypothetical protein n=1 Tax=unclassified Vibrio TaxID=2614977 RepID=UPI0009787DBA|nr:MULTISPECIES: hypothetical protein [unclassified Vibrio]OMO36467.1 hypothetical protein BH584_04065 [Vibrio sp. 10N.261.45.E1]PMJ22133.1 hypothetical protein BCU27_17105 [Vibrio sp. 10N.286.45.B6]PML97423.1 hypothetical protein BCT66_21095 [Vibrio sp. 10N.261.49.E11]PMM76555.1 hypothetical protein BCT48_01950 [Vibrio sp. 10N.261.46.F12]PMM82486.1 hypothetical protein BCT46_14135 [Vibrio sp. 10N.261.46.E8]
MNLKKLACTTLAMGILASSLSGCGTVVAMRAGSTQFDLQTQAAAQNLEAHPVKNPVFHRVQTVTVANYIDLMDQWPDDNKRIYKVMVKQVEKALEESGEFKVVSNDKFRKEIERQDPSIDLETDDGEELNNVLAGVGKAVGAHAVISLDLEAEENVTSMGNQLTYMKDVIVSGEVRLPMELSLSAIRSKTGEVVYRQAKMVDWVSGSSGLQNTKTKRLNKVIKTAVEPMVVEMANSH